MLRRRMMMLGQEENELAKEYTGFYSEIFTEEKTLKISAEQFDTLLTDYILLIYIPKVDSDINTNNLFFLGNSLFVYYTKLGSTSYGHSVILKAKKICGKIGLFSRNSFLGGFDNFLNNTIVSANKDFVEATGIFEPSSGINLGCNFPIGTSVKFYGR